MVTISLSPTTARNAANRLRDFLATDGISLKQTNAYEALAQMLGYANWNTLQGLLNGRPSKESADSTVAPMLDARGQVYTIDRLAEQAAPRNAIPFDPEEFDKFVGCYELNPVRVHDQWIIVMRKGEQFLMRMSGQKKLEELFPESETKFFALTHTPTQISFVLNAQDAAECLVFHANGLEITAKRVDVSVVTAFEDALQKYIADNKPSPEREVLLRRTITASQAGVPNYEDMAPWVVESTRRTWPTIRQVFVRLGKLTDLKFLHVKDRGLDVYKVTFENGELIWEVGPLTRDHKLAHTWYDFA